jgi:hypothetical protein
MILITGIGRCGTSMMAKYLQVLGLDIGADRWYEPINAGLENRETLSINARLIRHFVKGESIDLGEVHEDIHELDFDAVKDTQFLTDWRIIDFWDSVRQDFEVIWMMRDYDQIVESMKRTPEWNTPVYRLFPYMMKQKEDEFKRTMRRLHIPFKQVHYPVQDFSAIADVLDLPDNAEQIWNQIYSTSKPTPQISTTEGH